MYLSGGDGLASLSAQFRLSLEPVFRIVSIVPSALLVEFVCAEPDFLFLGSAFVPEWCFGRGGLLAETIANSSFPHFGCSIVKRVLCA